MAKHGIVITLEKELEDGIRYIFKRNGFSTSFDVKSEWKDNESYIEKILVPQFESRQKEANWMREP
ncbi:hypothetical protein [Selenomonas ruminantium]|uniref:hypothetical protein n=1 Tax=Selenomonas ruminantium TaxID=971 RepID=UPI0026EE77EC|nr:hypothetical protein [Selenomonas ruminantium]